MHWRLTGDPAPCMRLTAQRRRIGPASVCRARRPQRRRPFASDSRRRPSPASRAARCARRAHSIFLMPPAGRGTHSRARSAIHLREPRSAWPSIRCTRRSQDQLHIHISCLNPSVYGARQTQAMTLGAGWSAIRIGAARYEALRIMGSELDQHNPFELLAAHLPHADDVHHGWLYAFARGNEPHGRSRLCTAHRHPCAACRAAARWQLCRAAQRHG